MAVDGKPPADHFVSYAEDQAPGMEMIQRNINILWKRVKMLAAIVLLVLLLLVALVVVVIVLGVHELREDKRDDRAVGTVGSSSSLNDGSAAYISTSSSIPDGFEAQGTLGASSGTWLTKASFPASAGSGISDGSAVAANGLVYHIGGHVGVSEAGGNNVTAAVYIYDPLLDTFDSGASLPQSVARGAAAYDGKSTIYYTAGVTREGNAGETTFGGPNTPCVFSLDVSNNNGTWQSVACMAQPRSDHCAAWAEGKLYVVGGYDGDFTPLDSIEVFDPAGGTWSDAGMKLPVGRGDHACAMLDDTTIAVVGGINATDWSTAPDTWFTDTVVAVDTAGSEVRALAAMPARRGDVALAAISAGVLMVMGGETTTADGTRTTVASHDVAIYHSTIDTWVSAAPMSGARFRATAAAVPSTDGAVSVAVFGGHHRCETWADFEVPNDDGGCDEIGSVELYIGSSPSLSPLFVFGSTSGSTTAAALEDSGSVVVSSNTAVTGYTRSGSVQSGGGYWTNKSPLLTARSDFHAVVVDGKVHLLGGSDKTATTVHPVDVYDPVLDTFTTSNVSLAGAKRRVRFAAGAIGENIYLAGGLKDNAQNAKENTLLIVNLASGAVTDGPNMAVGRSDACGAVVGDKLYVVGGWSGEEWTTEDSVEIFDPASGSWSSGPSLPAPRGDCVAAAVGTTLYVTGGYYDDTNEWRSGSFHNTLFALDTTSSTWSELANMPTARGDAALVAVSGGLMVIGGETHARLERNQVASHDVHEYFIAQDVWVTKAPIPTARFRFDAVAVDDVVYAFGGHQTCETEDTCHQDAHASVQAFFDVTSTPLFLHVRS